ncbi:MAG: hypothetical protein L0241_30760 [Planctomycetia bacterium]|nr:hypothetical protein [Planctomycetia bacterium]
MATVTMKQTAQEFHDAFVREHGGPPQKYGTYEYVLKDGARVMHDGHAPTYHPVPAQPNDAWLWRYRWLLLRLEPFDNAIKLLTAIIHAEETQTAYARTGTAIRVLETPTFTWDVKTLGPAPSSKNPRVALLIVQSRRRKLRREMDALLAEPEAAVVLPLLSGPRAR